MPQKRCRLHFQVRRRLRRPLVSGQNWGGPDGRYRNIRSVSRRSVYSGRLLRVLHRPRSQCPRGARPGICTSRVAGGCRAHNGRRNMVDALRRHARVYHAVTDVLRHRSDHPFARGGDLRNRRRLLRHWSPERIAASPRSERHLHGTRHCRDALHRYGGNAGARRTQLRPAIRYAFPGHSDRRVDGLTFFTLAFASVASLFERQRAEEALRQAQANLAHVSRVMTLGELTASISHEVNQPIAAIATNGQVCLRLLALETPRPDEMRATVERIVRDANRASEVIQRIRALAKRSEPQMVSLDINDVIREAILLVQREVLSHGVSLRTDLASGMPPVLGDRVQLQQVVINLLMNGVEAMAPITDRQREILIRSEQHEADKVHVAVLDSGIGIESEIAEKVFSAFFTTKPSGMGMGLSISRSIIRAHGGRLWVSPNPDHGAAFQFTVPINGY